MAHERDVVIVGAARTPIGSFQGALAAVPAPRLGAVAIARRSSAPRSPRDAVDEVFMGCVLPAGVGPGARAPGGALRRAARRRSRARRSTRSAARACKAVIARGAQAIAAGDADIVVAGGMESMSQRALLPAAGARPGTGWATAQLIDAMIHDGLWDAVQRTSTWAAAPSCAPRRRASRASAQDAYAAESYRRALARDSRGPLQGRDRRRSRSRSARADDRRRRRRGAGRAATSRSWPACGPRSRRTARSPPATPRRSTTAPRRWCWRPATRRSARPDAARAASSAGGGHAQAPEWFTTAPAGAIETALQARRAGTQATSTCGRSTRRSRWSSMANNQHARPRPGAG